jgi:hypothetical protein
MSAAEEQELRDKIAEEIAGTLMDVIENCICLGRPAYGRYAKGMVNIVQNKIKNKD